LSTVGLIEVREIGAPTARAAARNQRKGRRLVTRNTVKPTGREAAFGRDEIIVSKTDTKGRLTYVNRLFMTISGYQEGELLGQPHNIIRHPDMPKSVFACLWETIAAGREIFAYVKNMTKTGDHYWVMAHVTPTFDADGAIKGYHSSRRTADRQALARIEPLYAELRAAETRHANVRESVAAGTAVLTDALRSAGREYDEFVLTL
jgi:PAS domain S-box-containing protein